MVGIRELQERTMLKHYTKPILRMIVPCLFFLVLLLTMVSGGDKPVASSGGLLTIIPLHEEYLITGSLIKIETHLYNSTGSMISNSTPLTCNIHIYNASNRHIVRAFMSYDGAGDWEYQLGTNISNFSGVYSYGIWCNSSTLNGYMADSFELTIDGKAKDGGLVLAGLLMLLPLLFAFLLMYWVSTLGEDHNVLKLGLSLFSVSFFFVSLWYGTLAVVRFTDWVGMNNALATTTFLVGAMYFVIVSYFIIYMLVKIFSGIGAKRDEKFEY